MPNEIAVASEATYRRRILDSNPLTVFKGRHGERAAANEFRFTSSGIEVQYPYQRVEMDWTLLDLFVVDEKHRLPIGRPGLMITRDSYTSMPCGFSLNFEPENWPTVMDCILHTILPKDKACKKYGTENLWPTCGLFDELVIDNAFWNQKTMEDVALSVPFAVDTNPPYMPWFKGGVERLIESVNENVAHIADGTSFSNIFARGDYDSLKYACVTLEALRKALYIFLVDDYSQDDWDGKGKRVDLWNEAMDNWYFPAMSASRDQLNILLGRVDDRTLQHYGIEFKNIEYQNLDELSHMRSLIAREKRPEGNKVKIKVNPKDLGQIYVWDHVITKDYITVPAAPKYQKYAKGLSLWAHGVIQKQAKLDRNKDEAIDLDALLEAKARVREIFDEEFEITKKVHNRKRAQRGKDNLGAEESPPKKPHPYEGAVLDDYSSVEEYEDQDADDDIDLDSDDWEANYGYAVGD